MGTTVMAMRRSSFYLPYTALDVMLSVMLVQEPLFYRTITYYIRSIPLIHPFDDPNPSEPVEESKTVLGRHIPTVARMGALNSYRRCYIDICVSFHPQRNHRTSMSVSPSDELPHRKRDAAEPIYWLRIVRTNDS